MPAPIMITHPETGETLCKSQWAKKLGISASCFGTRLELCDLTKALTPGKIQKQDTWTKAEDEYLATVYSAPNLQVNWNDMAERNGWRVRSERSLKARICTLKKNGQIDATVASPWLSRGQLSQSLGVSFGSVKYWIKLGMPIVEGRHCISKIHIQEFLEWAAGEGKPLVSKAIANKPLASTWLLSQIGKWPPKVQLQQNDCVRYFVDARSLESGAPVESLKPRQIEVIHAPTKQLQTR